jgi:phosphatidylglycerol:prolipoprotein diacylglycerol transferase
MATHFVHNLNPVILDLGALQVRWYGLMYVVGFLISGYLLKIQIRKNFFRVTQDKIDSLITTMIICMFLGARIFYVFIYNWGYYADHLTELLAVWKGGLSFHGALVGLITGGYLFGKRNNISLGQVMDNVALCGTQGIFWGRIGNFINGELYGRITDASIGVIFKDGGPYPRHPSQLYEGFLEGVLLFAFVWLMRTKVKRYGELSAIFIGGYGLLRFVVEFYREPDSQLGFYFGGVTMGQILCFIMIVVGALTYVAARKKNELI